MIDTFCSSCACSYGRVFVPSEGPQPSVIMIVCEAPGIREIEQGRPLVGPAGQLFDTLLQQAGLSRSNIRLANRCGCVDLEREDRRPLPAEMDACLSRLVEDIMLTSPKIVVLMGGIAIATFMPGLSISRARGKLRRLSSLVASFTETREPMSASYTGPITCLATYHPAYALPHRSPEVRGLIIEDLRKARDYCLGFV